MKKIILLSTAIIGTLSAEALAQSASFSETYADRLVSYSEGGEKTYETVTTGRFTTRGRALFGEELDLTSLDESTPVSVTAGNWKYEGTLGDDPKFTAGKKSASVKLSSGATLRIAFTKKSATWTVSGRTGSNGSDTFESSPKAADYAGAGESLTIKRSDGETLAYAVTLGTEHSLSGDLPLAGRVKSTVRKVGSGDFADEYTLMSVNLSASGRLE